jgi:uncharacterized membrane-anchored protein
MKTIMEAGENIYSGSELGYLASPNEKLEIIFEFEETGYVKDDEKESLDTAAMLKQLKASNKKGNKERKKRGWKTLDLVDWEIPPHYDEKTNNLEWATRLRTEENEELVNYNTRLLGRTGVMRVTLVTEPGNLENALPSFQNIISDFTYKSGYRYAEYRQGDKIAKYGLTALVVGGATAVAAKSGLLKGLWKLIVAGAVGVAAFLKKIVAASFRSPVPIPGVGTGPSISIPCFLLSGPSTFLTSFRSPCPIGESLHTYPKRSLKQDVQDKPG